MGGVHDGCFLYPDISACCIVGAYENEQIDTEVGYDYDIYNNMGCF
jgi:hypothetical protein